MVLANCFIALEERGVHGDGEIHTAHREFEVGQGLHVCAVLRSLAETIITFNVVVLLLEGIFKVFEDLSGEADVRVASLEGGIIIGVVGRHQGRVSVLAGGDFSLPSIRTDGHVEPRSFTRIVSIIRA